jgi:hypothetical protein
LAPWNPMRDTEPSIGKRELLPADIGWAIKSCANLLTGELIGHVAVSQLDLDLLLAKFPLILPPRVFE